MAGSPRAFTLVEMMIVVAIVLVLAAIAIPAFYNYQVTAKETEISTNVDGIQVAETAYQAAFDKVVLVLIPTPGVGGEPSRKTAVPWKTGTNFDVLGWKPDGNVRGIYGIDLGLWSEPWVARGCIDADADLLCRACEATSTVFQCGSEVDPGTPIDCAFCFAPGTPILMADGTSLPIEAVEEGDSVLAYDDQGRIGSYPVERTLEVGARQALLLELSDGTRIVATAAHPFFTGIPEQDPANDRMAWTRLGDLVPGDVVYRLDEDRVLSPLIVTHLTALPQAVPVYNLTVGGAHTFFADRVLTHNKGLFPCYGGGVWF